VEETMTDATPAKKATPRKRAASAEQAHTPYGAFKVVFGWLVEAGVNKPVTPQMFYNYTTGQIKKDKKPIIPVDKSGLIKESDLKEWFTKYIAKQTKNA